MISVRFSRGTASWMRGSSPRMTPGMLQRSRLDWLVYTFLPAPRPAARRRLSGRSSTTARTSPSPAPRRAPARPARELRISPASSSGTMARAQRLVGLAHELALRRRHGDARRAQLRIKLVDLGRRRDGELARRTRRTPDRCRVFSSKCSNLDAAEARREPHQVGKAQLRAGEIVPGRWRVLGGDPVGLDLDLLDVVDAIFSSLHRPNIASTAGWMWRQQA